MKDYKRLERVAHGVKTVFGLFVLVTAFLGAGLLTAIINDFAVLAYFCFFGLIGCPLLAAYLQARVPDSLHGPVVLDNRYSGTTSIQHQSVTPASEESKSLSDTVGVSQGQDSQSVDKVREE